MIIVLGTPTAAWWPNHYAHVCTVTTVLYVDFIIVINIIHFFEFTNSHCDYYGYLTPVSLELNAPYVEHLTYDTKFGFKIAGTDA